MAAPALERFIEHLPKKPYCSDDLDSGLVIRARDHALKRRYVQVNQRLVFYLVFDIDRPGAAFAANDAWLPAPTLTIVNLENRHGHLAYEIEAPVCATPSGRIKPLRYLAAIERAYRERLEADRGYAGLLIKNPLHDRWYTETTSPRFSLGQLAEYVELKALPARAPQEALGLGRNCTLFDTVRQWAYAAVSDFSAPEEWGTEVLGYARLHNSFVHPLPEREVGWIAKSVAKWTWTRRASLHKPRTRPLGFEPLPPTQSAAAHAEEVRRRQSLGAQYTNAKRSRDTEARVRAAIQACQRQGKRVTKSAVARELGLSREFIVKRYSKLFP